MSSIIRLFEAMDRLFVIATVDCKLKWVQIGQRAKIHRLTLWRWRQPKSEEDPPPPWPLLSSLVWAIFQDDPVGYDAIKMLRTYEQIYDLALAGSPREMSPITEPLGHDMSNIHHHWGSSEAITNSRRLFVAIEGAFAYAQSTGLRMEDISQRMRLTERAVWYFRRKCDDEEIPAWQIVFAFVWAVFRDAPDPYDIRAMVTRFEVLYDAAIQDTPRTRGNITDHKIVHIKRDAPHINRLVSVHI